MEKNEAIAKAEDLLKQVKTIVLATQSEDGYPSPRIMMKNDKNTSVNTVYITTQTGSRKTKELEANSKTAVYYVAEDNSMNVWLTGEAIVTRDKEIREKLWTDYSPRVYPGGVDDPKYTVIVFTPKKLRVRTPGKEIFEYEL